MFKNDENIVKDKVQRDHFCVIAKGIEQKGIY